MGRGGEGVREGSERARVCAGAGVRACACVCVVWRSEMVRVGDEKAFEGRKKLGAESIACALFSPPRTHPPLLTHLRRHQLIRADDPPGRPRRAGRGGARVDGAEEGVHAAAPAPAAAGGASSRTRQRVGDEGSVLVRPGLLVVVVVVLLHRPRLGLDHGRQVLVRGGKDEDGFRREGGVGAGGTSHFFFFSVVSPPTSSPSPSLRFHMAFPSHTTPSILAPRDPLLQRDPLLLHPHPPSATPPPTPAPRPPQHPTPRPCARPLRPTSTPGPPPLATHAGR